MRQSPVVFNDMPTAVSYFLLSQGNVDKTLQASTLMSALNELACGSDIACGYVVTLSDDHNVDGKDGVYEERKPRRKRKKTYGMIYREIVTGNHPLDVIALRIFRLVTSMISQLNIHVCVYL